MNDSNFISLSSDGGLQKKIIKEGNGENPANNNEVEGIFNFYLVHYTGKLDNGEVFDSSRTRNNTFKFVLGKGSVIKGWDEGVKTMKRGEIAEFKFSADYGYGARGAPPKIPANANLNFEIELINFKETEKPKWELDPPEKIAKAQKLKDEGVALFKEKNFKEASEKFEQGYSFLENLGSMEITNDISEKRSNLLLNLANCYNNLKEYQKTIDKCEKAIKIKENPKCYYYRGVNYFFLYSWPILI